MDANAIQNAADAERKITQGRMEMSFVEILRRLDYSPRDCDWTTVAAVYSGWDAVVIRR